MCVVSLLLLFFVVSAVGKGPRADMRSVSLSKLQIQRDPNYASITNKDTKLVSRVN